MKKRYDLISLDFNRLSVRRQCEILDIPRSSLYYKPTGEKTENLKMMRILDGHLLNHA
jgi:putative transposase